MAKSASKWVICYIDPKQLHLLTVDLRKYPKYKSVEYYIPTIDILKKRLKGKNHFEKVPLLFNYGFFKVPKYFIPNPHFLNQMKDDLRCLYGWVRDPAVKNRKEPTLIYGRLTLYNPSNVAIAKEKEIKILRQQEQLKSIYSEKDIDTLYVGKIIVLRKYPFENLTGQIKHIDHSKKEVQVKLLLDTIIADKPVKISFENIFYSAYQENYLDLEMKEKSIEVIKSKFKNFEGSNDEEG